MNRFTLSDRIALHMENPNKYTVIKSMGTRWVVFFGGSDLSIGVASSFRAAIDEVIPSHINTMRGL